jgi:hypothetical protein
MSKNDEIETTVQKGAEQNFEPTARVNIDDINKRNTRERKQEKRSTYIVVGIVLVLIIVVAIYLFANKIFGFYIFSS